MPNMMATCSVDEYVKIWDIAHNGGTEPKLISYKKLSMVIKSPSHIYYRANSSQYLSIRTFPGFSPLVAPREK